MRTAWVLLLLCSMVHGLYGQEFHRWSVGDGLPTMFTFHVTQDTAGYIWIGTNAGLVKFDGYTFRTYTDTAQVPHRMVFKLYPQPDGRILGSGYGGSLFWIEDGTPRAYEHNQVLLDSVGLIGDDYQVAADPQGTLHLSNRNGHFTIDSLGAFSTIAHNAPYTGNAIIEIINGIPLTYNADLGPGLNMLYINGTDTIDTGHINPGRPNYAITCNGSTYALGGKMLYRIDEEGQLSIQHFDKQLIYVTHDKSNNLYVGMYTGGFARLNDTMGIDHLFLPNLSVSGVLDDAQGGIWASTIEDGLYYSPSLAMQFESTIPQTEVTKMHVVDSTLWIAHVTGWIDTVNAAGIAGQMAYPEAENSIKHLFDFHVQDGELREAVAAPSGVDVRLIDRLHSGRAIVHKDGAYTVASFRAIRKFRNDSLIAALDRLPNEQLALAHYKGWLAMGTNHGLQFRNPATLELLDMSIPELGNDVRVLTLHVWNGWLVAGTNKKGLVLWNGEELVNITRQDGLLSNLINTACVNGNEFWVGTAKGICKVELAGSTFEVKAYFACPGYLEPSAIAVFNGKVWIGTSKGALTLADQTPPASSIQNLLIEYAVVGSDTIQNPQQITVPAGSDGVQLTFVGINYSQFGNINYRYRLTGNDDAWSYTTARTVNYLALSAGEYQFMVHAQDGRGKWHELPTPVTITVEAPFWQTAWFRLLVALLVAAVVLLSLYLQRRRNQVLVRMAELKSVALRSQMNPHFIFNAMNSIRGYIFSNQPTEADAFLVQFSKLVRTILQNSQAEQVPLDDEIELLTAYVQLEQMRAGNSFQYAIDVDPDLPFTAAIPSMVVQPFVENAILHGLGPLEGREGNLSIKFAPMATTGLLVTVEDNGVGRAAKSPKRSKHQSIGIKLTQERMQLLHRASTIGITDLKSASGAAAGTRVEIRFPAL